MQRDFVQDAWLQVGDVNYPAASFSVTYELDKIPKATFIPALGRNMSTGEQLSVGDIETGDAVELHMKFNDVDKLLFSGYVGGISADDNATIVGRSLSATIQLVHRSVVLAGSSPVSSVYAANASDVFTRLSDMRAGVTLLGTGPKAELDGWTTVNTGFSEQPGAVQTNTSQMLEYIVTELMKTYSPTLDMFELLHADKLATLNKVHMVNEVLVKKVVGLFSSGWKNTNTWEMLRKVAGVFFLNIVPYNTGLYITCPLALNKTSSMDIKTTEYVGIRQSVSNVKQEPVSGVIVQAPLQKLNNEARQFSYPDVTDSDAKKVYYHITAMPSWLTSVSNQFYGDVTEKVTRTKRSSTKKDKADETFPEKVQVIGPAIARMTYSVLKLSGANIMLVMPYRDDLMPGTNIGIVNSDAEDMSFIGDTLYGMITRTTVSCSVLNQASKLNTTIQIGGVRSSEDNEALGLDTHPMYDTLWKGTDMFGTLLDDDQSRVE